MSEEMANSHMLVRRHVTRGIFPQLSDVSHYYLPQVYSPVTESSFKSRRLPDAKVNVTCTFSGFTVDIKQKKIIEANIHCLAAVGVFPLPNVKLTWGNFDLFADKMTAEVNPHSECYEVTTSTLTTVLPIELSTDLRNILYSARRRP